MTDKLRWAIALGSLLLGGPTGWAQERVEHTFEVSVSIPTPSFYVIPADPNWIHREQQLAWNPVTSQLAGLRKSLDVRHDAGAIEAKLDSPAYLSTGVADAQVIPLTVMFNNVQLTHLGPVEVVSQVEAAAGKRVLLDITAQPLTEAGYRPGSYYGSVNIMFNAVVPTP